MALCTLAIAGITATYTHYASKQVEHMKNAVNEAIQMRNDTNTANSNALIEMGKQSSAMQAAAAVNKKAVELAEGNIKATQDQFRLDQRAWVNIKEAKFKEPLIVNRPNIIEIPIVNSGKTPALRVCFRDKIWFEMPQKTIMGKETIDTIEMVYGPGVERPTEFVWDIPMPQVMIDLIHSRNGKLWVDFEVTYFDVFDTKKIHHSRSCFYYHPRVDRFVQGERCSHMD